MLWMSAGEPLSACARAHALLAILRAGGRGTRDWTSTEVSGEASHAGDKPPCPGRRMVRDADCRLHGLLVAPDRPGRAAGRWPGGKRFAFTIFDDTDLETVANAAPVYDFLTEIGMRITKSVWVLEPDGEPKYGGESCEDPAYLEWVRSLRDAGHEIALHNVSSSTATRERTRLGFERYRELFGGDPRSLANHTGNEEAIYHGEARVTGR